MADKLAKSSDEDAKPTRSVKEIEADLGATRDRLARTVDELAFRVSPAHLKAEGKAKVDTLVADVKAQLLGRGQDARGRARGTVYDEQGGLRLDTIATALGGVAAVAITLGLARRVFWRGDRS